MQTPKHKELNFSYNWNKKLHNNVFTTIRQSGRLDVGDKISIKLNDFHMKFGTVLIKKYLPVEKLNETMCYLDTGYNREETLEIISKMFGAEKISDEAKIYWYLIGPWTLKQGKLDI